MPFASAADSASDDGQGHAMRHINTAFYIASYKRVHGLNSHMLFMSDAQHDCGQPGNKLNFSMRHISTTFFIASHKRVHDLRSHMLMHNMIAANTATNLTSVSTKRFSSPPSPLNNVAVI